jgi:DNA-binding NarL/FixJ family response regulator
MGRTPQFVSNLPSEVCFERISRLCSEANYNRYNAGDRAAMTDMQESGARTAAAPGRPSALPPRTDYHGAAPAAHTTVISVSEREQTVLHWLAEGKTACEIAVILNISVCTVRAHIRNIVCKLNASNVTHAVARGFRGGLLHCQGFFELSGGGSAPAQPDRRR